MFTLTRARGRAHAIQQQWRPTQKAGFTAAADDICIGLTGCSLLGIDLDNPQGFCLCFLTLRYYNFHAIICSCSMLIVIYAVCLSSLLERLARTVTFYFHFILAKDLAIAKALHGRFTYIVIMINTPRQSETKCI